MSQAQRNQASSSAKSEQLKLNRSATRRSQVGDDTKPSAGSKVSAISRPGSQEDLDWQEEVERRPRDLITGRTLAEDGDSCLRCVEKGLRCTLNFLGVEGAPKCSGCKRSETHCVRQRAVNKRIKFSGPPWKNPNFFAVDEKLSREEMQELLKQHYLGDQKYANGTYIYEADTKQMALPPFNGSDLPIDERPRNWQSMDWQRVLPTWKNRSLHPRPATASKDLGSEEEPEYVSEDTLRYLRVSRKYPPREMHVKEFKNDMEDTW
ncbi:hypothetical protein F4677DRAFT_392655 [Hypoxylon crocopeplum]|nr:hypothetical protein F4677DRAFT_392655 [Hypoxylon crocopeplum]